MPLTAFERGLRPVPSSNRMLVWAVLAVGLLAVLALALAPRWRTGPPQDEEGTRRAARDQAAGRTVPAAPLPPVALPAPQPRIARFTKCINAAGAASYSDGPCPAGMRSATVEVRPDLNLADGLTAHAREASAQQNREAVQARAAYERRVAQQIDSGVSECANLESLITALDAQARQPQRAETQDDLRTRRKLARDRQFALRC